MTIAPVHAQVEVRQTPERAFELFTTRIGEWWVNKGIGEMRFAALTLEPFDGGRWYETASDGTELVWGKVIAWQPPGRVLLVWEINARFHPDPSVVTEIEITFTPTDAGGTRIELEHRNLEAFGADAERLAGMIGSGWPKQLGGFGEYCKAD